MTLASAPPITYIINKQPIIDPYRVNRSTMTIDESDD